MITDAFDLNTKAVIEPDSFSGKRTDMPDTLLVSFDHAFTDRIWKKFSPEETAALYTGHRIPVWKLEYRGRSFGYYQSDIGAPAAAALLENAFARGAERVLFFGSGGSLDRKKTKGNIIVPVKAYRDEGTSYHYAPPSDYITVDSSERLSEILNEINVPYTEGKTWTTDAIFRETEGNVKKRRDEGCLIVEMECAALMACAQFRRKEVYQFLYSADCLDGTYDRGILNHPENSAYDRILDIAMECVIRL